MKHTSISVSLKNLIVIVELLGVPAHPSNTFLCIMPKTNIQKLVSHTTESYMSIVLACFIIIAANMSNNFN